MATITTDLICNLNQPVAATFLHGNLFSQDNAGNTINVHVMDNGEPATIGGTVSANVIRADGNTVAVSGSLSGNQCSVVLPQACYAVPGRVEIIIKLTQSTTITTIAAIVANVYRSTTDTVVDPGTIIPSIQALIEEIEDAVDSIPVDYSGLLATIAADYSSSKTYPVVGMYAWQGGVLKRNIVPITTAETYTAAHWTNVVIGDDLSALKSAFVNNYMLNNVLAWEQGYWAIANGSPMNATTWIRSKDFVADNIKSLLSINDIIVYIQAWNKTDSSYVGTWNGSAWSTTYTAGSGLENIDIDSFRVDYPNYKFKLTCISKNTPARNITPSDGQAIYFAIDEASAKQITENKRVSEMSVNVLKKDFQIENNVSLTVTAGKFINASNNSIATSDGYGITNPIAVKKGQKITLTASGYSTTVGMIAVCNADNTSRETKVPSVDSSEHNYEYEVEADGYIVCSFKTTQPYSLSIDIDYFKYVSPLDDNLIFKGTVPVSPGVGVNNAFVNATNDTVAENSNYAISGTIKLYKGQKLTLEAYGYSTTTGMICEYHENNGTYETLVASTGSGTETYEYTATKTIKVRCSYNKNNPVSFEVTTPESRFVILDNEQEENAGYAIQYPQMFNNVVFVGDSLTYGHDGEKRIDKNYPFFFGKLADCTVSNQGLSGRTAKQWWDELGVSFDFSGFDCAIIYLGTNQGLTDTVDEDCKEDYTQNTDNNTGCYGKIIGKIQATNPGCKIFLIAGPEEYHSRETAMNPAVRSLASFYDCGLIDLEDSILSDDGTTTSRERKLYRPVDGIHYDVLGYLTFANLVYDSMTNVMSANLADYKY